MRQPPPVSHPTTTPAAWQHAMDLMAGLACTVLAAWALAHVRQAGTAAAWTPAAVAVVGAALSVWCDRRMRQLPAGRLSWDGQQWQWQADAVGSPAPQAAGPWPGVQIVLDLGRWMLLQLPATSHVRWLAIERGESASTWHLMRCAVYSSGSATSAFAARPAVTMPPGTPTIHHER